MRRLLLVLMCVLIAAVPLRAKQKGKGKGESGVVVRFRVEDVREIKSGLPPGLQKKLRREGRLPPGWEKKMVWFPEELERRLPPLRPGLRRGLFEAQAVICDERTGLILDVATVFDP